MHSSDILTADLFELSLKGTQVHHAEHFASLTTTERIGIVANFPTEAVGACTLIMAYVTGFYDRYREAGEDFFAYPDYYCFQSGPAVASYGMFDIWPDHKSVQVSDDPGERLNVILDRGITTLIVPDGTPNEHSFDSVQASSAARTITTCYAYSFTNETANADLMIACPLAPMTEWADTVFDSKELKGDATSAGKKAQWQQSLDGSETLTQSFRTISLKDALSYI